MDLFQNKYSFFLRTCIIKRVTSNYTFLSSSSFKVTEKRLFYKRASVLVFIYYYS